MMRPFGVHNKDMTATPRPMFKIAFLCQFVLIAE